jgi:uridine kinase
MPAEIYLIGIAGPSGAGKTYLATHLAAALRGEVLALDRYYRDLSHLPPDARALANFDAPEALEHELLIEQMSCLRKGEAVELPVYDFSTHTRTGGTDTLHPSGVLIVEGLFTLHWPGLRDLLGTRVFVDMNDETCLDRRKARDVRERGRTPQSVVEQYQATVAPMAHRYVRPTIAHADVVIGGDEDIAEGVARVLKHCQQKIALDKLEKTTGARP